MMTRGKIAGAASLPLCMFLPRCAALLLCVSLLMCASLPSGAQTLPYLPCGEVLTQPYGISANVTRKYEGEFERRDEALKLIALAGAQSVRVPLSWDYCASQDGTLSFRTYDAAVEAIAESPLSAVGIISPKINSARTAWTDPAAFSQYLKSVLLRYRTSVNDWEVFSGSDNIYSAGSKVPAQSYHAVLRGVYRLARTVNPNARVLLGTPYDIRPDFLDSLAACGSMDCFDVMTFTTYDNPESILQTALKIRRAMKRCGWSKPVWLANVSCGYRPCTDAPFRFWKEDVPSALRIAGLDPGRTDITVVSGALNKYELAEYLGAFRSVSFTDALSVHSLDVKKCPLLVPGANILRSEVEAYVRAGGIVILGSPRWPETTHVGVAPGRFLSDSNLEEGEKMHTLASRSGKIESAYYALSSGGVIALAGKGPREYIDCEAVQAQKLARIHILAFAAGVEKVFWSSLRSLEKNPAVKRDFAGLCRKDLSEKPAMASYRTLTQMLPDGSTRPELRISGNVYIASWRRPDGKSVSAVWTSGSDAEDRFRVIGKASFTDHLGNRMKVSGAVSGGVTYVVGADRVEFIESK